MMFFCKLFLLVRQMFVTRFVEVFKMSDSSLKLTILHV